MRSLNNKVAVVTGASSGIGRALALHLAGQGCHVALADVDESGLAETAAMVSSAGVQVSSRVVDVADRAAVEQYAQAVALEHGGVDVVINNAGVAAKSSIEEVSYEDFEWVVGVNVWGVIHGVKAFLPLLRERPWGHIVVVSSINAMVPFPKNGPYNLSKFAVAGLAETLEQELMGSSIGVSVVHPGGIKTDIVRRARGMDAQDVEEFDRAAKTTPERAAKVIVRAIRRDQFRVYIGADARMLAWSKRLFPQGAVRLAGWLVARREAKLAASAD